MSNGEITELFADPKFERIVYFFQERGLKYAHQLRQQDLEELFFVPGVNDVVIEEAFKRIENIDVSESSITTSNNGIEKSLTEDYIDYVIEIDEKKVPTESAGDFFAKDNDALISEVFASVPRSRPLINYCFVNQKKWMSQLSEEDFDKVACLKGIGENSLDKLRSIYRAFMSEEQEELDIQFKLERNEIFGLQISIRAKNCLKRENITSIDQLLLLNEIDLMNMRNMGIKTAREILEIISKLNMSDLNSGRSKGYNLSGIAEENKNIPVSFLGTLGVDEQGISLLMENGCITVRDLCKLSLRPRQYSYIKPLIPYLSVPVSTQFINEWNLISVRNKKIFIGRSLGSTLQELGYEISVTRERARQILGKIASRLTKSADLLAASLLIKNKGCFTSANCNELFNEELSAVFALVLSYSSNLKYLPYCDKYMGIDNISSTLEEKLSRMAEEIIGDGTNFYDSIEVIETSLTAITEGRMDFVDFMNYLTYHGYVFFGDFVMKGRLAYGEVCCDAVKKYFDFDIKLDSDCNNADLIKLRSIVSKHYKGLKLPNNNRALTAAMARHHTKLILSGRGRYCPIEKVVYTLDLFDEIYASILNNTQTSFYYSELYYQFQGRLLAETNINNHNFLHGMLKYLYSDEFTFERDLMVKKGGERANVDERICRYLHNNVFAVAIEDIKKVVPGINDVVINCGVMRNKNILQWEFNKFRHSDHINSTPEDLKDLKNIISELTSINLGYASEVMIYDAVKIIKPNYLRVNDINNSQNLFYVLCYLFSNEFRFRRPHIVSPNFPVKDLNVINIARIFLDFDISLNYNEFDKLGKKLKWPDNTLYAVFAELQKDYVRITEDDYIRKDHLLIEDNILHDLREQLSNMVKPHGFLSLNNIFEYQSFPRIPYEWNGFLLESLVAEYDLGFRIITPQFKDRRYQRGIIVSEKSSFQTIDELVVGILKEINIRSISEMKLKTLLRMRGVIVFNLPHDLYDSLHLTFRDELFVVN